MEPQKIPLLATVSQRGSTATIDARLINGFVEKLQDGQVVAVKRPGSALYSNPATGNPGGLYYWTFNDKIYMIVGTTFYENGSNKGTVANETLYTFSQCLGATPSLLIHGEDHVYSWDGTTLTEQTAAEALLTGLEIFSFGAAYLDGTSYLATNNAIYGSGINDLSTWDPLNVIQAQMSPDDIVFLFRHFSYVMALKQTAMEGFYDEGNATGSPLARADGVFINYGCRHATTFQQLENTCLWVTSTKGGGLSVMEMDNMTPKLVSTPAVERLLEQATFAVGFSSSMAFRIGGHRFYILNLMHDNITLVFDLDTREWFQWTDASGNYWPYVHATTTSSNQTILQATNGALYRLDVDFFVDQGTITVDLYTPNWDGGTAFTKYLPRMDFHTDQATSGAMLVRCSDDDYQTWSNFRRVNLGQKNPRLTDCGSFRKRAWHFRYFASTAFRMNSVELWPQLGTN